MLHLRMLSGDKRVRSVIDRGGEFWPSGVQYVDNVLGPLL